GPRARGFARRGSCWRARDQLGPTWPVADLPPARARLLAGAVRGLEVALLACALARGQGRCGLGVERPEVLERLGGRQLLEPEDGEHLAQVAVADAAAAAVCLAYPFEHRVERGGRVEVVGEALEERLLVLRHVAWARSPRVEPAERLSQALDAPLRVGELGRGERERLAVVAG